MRSFSHFYFLSLCVVRFRCRRNIGCPVLTWRLYGNHSWQDLARAAILGLALGRHHSHLCIGQLVARHAQSSDKSSSTTDQSVEGFPALNLLNSHCVDRSRLVLPVFELLVWISDGVNRQLTFVSQWDATFATLLLSALVHCSR